MQYSSKIFAALALAAVVSATPAAEVQKRLLEGVLPSQVCNATSKPIDLSLLPVGTSMVECAVGQICKAISGLTGDLATIGLGLCSNFIRAVQTLLDIFRGSNNQERYKRDMAYTCGLNVYTSFVSKVGYVYATRYAQQCIVEPFTTNGEGLASRPVRSVRAFPDVEPIRLTSKLEALAICQRVTASMEKVASFGKRRTQSPPGGKDMRTPDAKRSDRTEQVFTKSDSTLSRRTSLKAEDLPLKNGKMKRNP
ncbi:uncharacterized protein FOMMEDRAFT_25496 [Fomitiporia mediterranea MF3/22]|uniref:uncharacterized protein n=1 Tax=Fomitiporia mediterranea (strain MF3/22) TaxID=694068 RepID=UPI00044072DB|nr:uncharacterized protein FOMMEDRAFT_25496 [Fomitiporia mediterranea MF3/22]EJD08423.1 hypothetical protein FOMMEDRAFT_25496 [Fomitiporia mediterranea MF3/22]